MAATQRRFAVMGDNLFKILNKLVSNKNLCRLLKYQNSNPLNKEELEDKKIREVKLPLITEMSVDTQFHELNRYCSKVSCFRQRALRTMQS